MDEQPEALRLADELTAEDFGPLTNAAAAELYRLHGVNNELLTALKEIEWSNDDTWRTERARAAIAKATGELK
jgi:xanthine dehydrogenase iron-sulfur cluster and FAD-binding subunit A